jgi:hypothetical protein
MFASKITKTLEVMDDAGQPVSVTIRKLSRRSLEAASQARQSNVARVAREMGAEMVRAYQDREAAKDEATKVLDPAEARFTAYDVETTLVNGIMEWSAPVSVPEGVADLDEETSDTLFKAIITLSVPTPEERAEVEGKS